MDTLTVRQSFDVPAELGIVTLPPKPVVEVGADVASVLNKSRQEMMLEQYLEDNGTVMRGGVDA